MYPQVEQYYETVDEAYRDYRRKTDDKREATHREIVAEPTKREELNRRFRDARQALQEAYEQAKADAFKELTASIEQTGDTFAAWLVNSDAFTEYSDHAKEVLGILPATQERIRQFGREQGWCNVLDDYLRQARNAGAFGPVDQAVVASEEMHAWFSRDFTSHPAYHNRLDGFVNRIVVAEVSKAVSTQQARVDEVWLHLAKISPSVIDLAQAEVLFRQAVKTILTGEPGIATSE